ncbi:hypothetical protein L226DRAFT_567351 [Lentinus tigrinus ALCF2SS1-7]|uniref:Uncharacterized protein n=1 Tax=Lentinus tigrinus ALCF2SS1-6 TaxID=1328759 RepID=A0A5C2SP60_9APHY|nr:hypothetical protein L227DRAFT_210723 [Lentinus tigrinus ALCF2SS1-6]RPD79182.1 hypothetical protein L226DRAFT_567351 [Lentinus tigrinus ALCF2SS1-7]
MAEQLTPDTCARLNASSDNVVLVSTPVLKVVDVADANLQLWDFAVTRVATVTDGEATTQVALPDSLRVWASGTGPQRQTVSANDVIKVQRMLRLPHDDTSVILVHDVEICSEEDVPLEVTNYEDKIESLQAALNQAEAALRELMHADITPNFVDAVMQLVMSINETIEQAMP